ncbi:hypothetical protein ACHAO7_011598, partial [Fusarium culmorum]
MSFGNSSHFADLSGPDYKPFRPLNQVRELFDHQVNICLAIGGWGDNVGFNAAIQTDQTMETFARKVKQTLDSVGFDCLDIDWEYPGGNGEDHKRINECDNVKQIKQFPKFLQKIKQFIGDKQLSIAVPGLKRDMLAYVSEYVSIINKNVDFINVMSYDLMNRRDHLTTHHVSVEGAESAIDNYLSLGFPASKLVLGIPFYAKWFATKEGQTCNQPTGCPTELLEDPQSGVDTGKSGFMTFEAINFAEPPAELTISPSSTCGVGTSFRCPDGSCCAASGW